MSDDRPSTSGAAPSRSQCAGCGAPFICGAVAGLSTCWCMAQPTVAATDLDANLGCYCPACLQRRLSATKDVAAPPT
ncbi:MAG: cysteine-rich CWC family protein [Candidatus Accumulibacter sp.]|nr:cysteine-rich CWC family protein [Accumulibacter sp.]